MSITSRFKVLLVFLALTSAMMVIAAALGAKFTSLAAALSFSFIAANTVLALNQPVFGDPGGAVQNDREVFLKASRINARLMACIYGWGALTIFAIYGLTQLWWFHSWQYASAMGLIAVALLGFTHLLGDPDSQFRSPIALDAMAFLAMVQAAAAALGMGFLIGSGKLSSIKPDWPANHVFVGGGMAIIVASVVAAITHLRLKRAADELD